MSNKTITVNFGPVHPAAHGVLRPTVRFRWRSC